MLLLAHRHRRPRRSPSRCTTGHEPVAEASDARRPRRTASSSRPASREVLRRGRRDAGRPDRHRVGIGPGPFTGLRVGLVTAPTMGYALGIPVHGVCSLDALAEQALAEASDGVDELARRHRRAAQGGLLGALRAGGRRAWRSAGGPAVVRAGGAAGRRAAAYRPWARAACSTPTLFPVTAADPLDVDAGRLARLAARRLAAGDADAGRAALPAPARTPLRRPPSEVGRRERPGRRRLTRCARTTCRQLAARSRPSSSRDDAWTEQTWWAELAGRPRRAYLVAATAAGRRASGYAGLDHGGDVADVMTVAVAPRASGSRPRAACCSRSWLGARPDARGRGTSCSRCAPTTSRRSALRAARVRR